jgi:hypothetical protein
MKYENMFEICLNFYEIKLLRIVRNKVLMTYCKFFLIFKKFFKN